MTNDTDTTTRRMALLAATVSSFLSPFTGAAMVVALPTIAREFNMSVILMTWAPMAFALSGATFLLPFGKAADIYGRKKIFAAGIASFTLGSVILGMTASGPTFIAAMVFLGIGGSMIFGTGVSILLSVYPPSERGKVLGITIGAVYLGLSTGPFFSGILITHLGWRSIFLLNGPLGLAVLGLVFWKLKGEWAEARGEKFDLKGSAVYCAAVFAVMYGFHLLPGISGVLFLASGMAGLALFLFIESKVRSPILDWGLFRHNRVFALSNAATFINYSATYSISFLISLYLQSVKHLGPQWTGVIMVAQPAMQVLVTPWAGKLSDRVEPQKVASWGMAVTVLGLAAFAFLRESTPLSFVVAVLAVHGFGFALFSSPNTNAVMGSVDKRFYGVASGIVSTMRLLGNSFSIGTVMLIFSLYIGQAQITPHNQAAFVASVRVIFAVFALLCLAGVFASLSRGKMRQ